MHVGRNETENRDVAERRPPVSVVLATYNGATYIREQLTSVLGQLGPDDEVIVSDDGSTDGTLTVVEELHDERVVVGCGPGQGFVRNFECAIAQARHDFVFLCDQDDVWRQDKVAIVMGAFNDRSVECVSHRFRCIDESGQLIADSPQGRLRHGVLRNIIRSSYTGCCMAFTRSLVTTILPFPRTVIAHDQWIGLLTERRGSSRFIDDALIDRRIHSTNISRRLSPRERVVFRSKMLWTYTSYACKVVDPFHKQP
jgi:glycosyltransferase involved in cell wall biosynthesis